MLTALADIADSLRDPGAVIDGLRRALLRRRLVARRARFYLSLASALERGENLVEFLENQATRSRTGLAPVFNEWAQTMSSGGRLSDAIMGWVPANEAMVVAASERRSDFNQSLRKLAADVVLLRNTRRSVLRPVVRAIFAVLLSGVALIAISLVLIEPLVKTLAQPELATVAIFVSHWWIAIAAAAVLGVMGLLASLPVLTGPLRQWLDRLPLYNLYAAFSSTSFLVALAAMLRGNVSVREALERLRGSASAYVQWHINRMVENLDIFGHRYGAAINTGMIPVEMIEEIEDWERSADFQKALDRIAQDNTQELAQVVQGRADTLDVVLGLAVGALVAFVVLGVLDFNYSLADRLGDVQRAVR